MLVRGILAAIFCNMYNGYIYTEHSCCTPGCKTVLVMDGNMKNHRDVCKATEAGYTKYDGLPGQVKTGCQKTPAFKSRYCHLHKPRVCIVSGLDDIDGQQDQTKSTEGVVEMILEKKLTRHTTYYKVRGYNYIPYGMKYRWGI